MTTDQRTNLKFLVRLGKSSEALCMLKKSTKSRLCLVQQFFSGTKDLKEEVRILRIIPGVEGLPMAEAKPISSL